MSDKHHEEGHTGPIKNSKQLLTTLVLAFILPVILIIGLVNFVGSAPKTGAGVGMHELAQAQRIQKVGTIEIRDANRPLRGGEEVYKGQCAACHATGVSGAPKFGEAGDWGSRLGHGFEALVTSAPAHLMCYYPRLSQPQTQQHFEEMLILMIYIWDY